MSKKHTHTIINKHGDIETVEKDQTKQSKRSSLAFPAKYANLGFYLITPILLGIFIGKFLDGKFQTGTFYTTTLLIFGTISTFYNLYTFIKDATTDKSSRSNRDTK